MELGMETAWSGSLTAVIAVLAYTFKSKADELARIAILLNKTREEIAKEYLTKSESAADINRIIDRLEALDAKLDRLMERS